MTPRRTPQTWEERFSPEFLAALDAIVCIHDEPRGARYCPLCRHALKRLRRGNQR